MVMALAVRGGADPECGGVFQFSGPEEQKIQQAVGTFCSNQPFALEIIKNRQKKDSRFNSFIQVSRVCVQVCVCVCASVP